MLNAEKKSFAIIGTAGIPAKYGGFETLAENIVEHTEQYYEDIAINVYCSGKKADYSVKYNANLIHINISANGVSSIIYDCLSIIHAIIQKNNALLILGVSGAACLPLIRIFTKAKIITNIDGIEWRREKWGKPQKIVLRILEKIAVRFSDVVISDNVEIQKYVFEQYARESTFIPYGGEHATRVSELEPTFPIPELYALKIARIEPENNIDLILSSFSLMPHHNLIIIGNWQSSHYGRFMFKKYSEFKNITMLDPIYDARILKFLRKRAKCYVHGHSAGGTNPTLVEAMHFGVPIAAYDCKYNRATTDNCAEFFSSTDSLIKSIETLLNSTADTSKYDLRQYAEQKLNWHYVVDKYLNIMFDEKLQNKSMK